MNTTECQRVLEDLAALAAGDPSAIEAHVDHLGSCEECRDARHDAERIGKYLAAAGDDYEAPEAMTRRVLAALDAVDEEAPSETSDPEAPPAPSRRRHRYALAAAALLLAGAGAGIYISRGSSDDRAPVASTSAVLIRADRAADDGISGIKMRAPGSDQLVPVTAGAVLAPGTTLVTDERTRALLRLAGGSELALNHLTELTLDPARPRAVRVRRGELMAEIARRPDAPNALFVTPSGRVQVLGTRFLLTVAGDLTSVRVTRGTVELSTAQGSARVNPGEEGIARAKSPPSVSPASNLAAAVAWSELSRANDAGQSAAPGIGELRAFKPGEKRDRDWKLRLGRHRVTVRIVGNVARTEIEETFHNDSDATLEGVYKFPLPSNARIDRLALDVKGKLEEGAFVDKERAAKIWRGVIARATPKKARPKEEIIWVSGPWRDPALLDWKRGGRFELRIFPIPRHGARTIKIAYTQTIEPRGADRRYVYPLPHAADGSSAADELDVDVAISGADPRSQVRAIGYRMEHERKGNRTHLRLHRKGFVPRGDLVVQYRLPDNGAELRAWTFRGAAAAAPTTGKRTRGGLDPRIVARQKQIAADDRAFALFALRPKLPDWRETRLRDYVMVVDSSQSMVGERANRARALVAAVIGEMDRRDRIAILACDISCKVMNDQLQAPSAELASRARKWLGGIDAAGASDLLGAIEAGARLADKQRGQREAWVLYIGDGTPSVGHRIPAAVADRIAAIRRDRKVSISAVGIGSDADSTILATMARAGGGHYVPFVPGQRLGSAALSILETTYGASLRDAVVTMPAALEEIGPVQLPTIRAGGELLMAARFRGIVRGDVILRGTVGGKPYANRFPIELVASTARGNGFVPRMWAALTIDRLEREGRGEDRARIVALSKAFGVLSRHTSLLVLESEAMFKAFGVDRAQPAVRWTGEEEADVIESRGTIEYAKAKAGKAARRRAASFKRPSFESTLDPFPGDRGRRMIPMRRIWERRARIQATHQVNASIHQAVAAAESRLASSPNSREAHRALVQALSYAGQLQRAYRIANQWLERDRLDPQALVYMSDVLGRMGHRDRSLRLLSGVVDIAPDNALLHRRLARAYDRIGDTDRSCAHRIALASIHPGDATAMGRAIRCERAHNHTAGADILSRAIASPRDRKRADRIATRPPPTEAVRGNLVLDATWDRAIDLDLTVVTPQGTRLSWMGGRKSVVASSAAERGREQLGLRHLSRGLYMIEVSRTDERDTTPVSGTIEVRALGERRTLRFRLTGARAVVGRLAVRMRPRLVPIR